MRTDLSILSCSSCLLCCFEPSTWAAPEGGNIECLKTKVTEKGIESKTPSLMGGWDGYLWVVRCIEVEVLGNAIKVCIYNIQSPDIQWYIQYIYIYTIYITWCWQFLHHQKLLSPLLSLSTLETQSTMPSNRFQIVLDSKTSGVNSDHLLKQAKRTMQAERTQNVSAVARVTIRYSLQVQKFRVN